MYINLSRIGEACAGARVKGGYTQEDVAYDLGYSRELISAFENGRSKNMNILLWYLTHGLNASQISKWVEW